MILERPFYVDKNVVDIGDNSDVEKVSKYIVDELLIGYRCVC
jgi:hypothetical protein